MESQKKYVSAEDPLKHGQICIKWITLVPEITNILNEKVYSTKARKNTNFDFKWWILWRTRISLSSSLGNFANEPLHEIPVSFALYFNQRLLNFFQYPAPGEDYIFLLGLCISITYYVHH